MQQDLKIKNNSNTIKEYANCKFKNNLDLIAPVKVSLPPLPSSRLQSPLPPLSFVEPINFSYRQTINLPPPPTLFALKGLSNMNLLT